MKNDWFRSRTWITLKKVLGYFLIFLGLLGILLPLLHGLLFLIAGIALIESTGEQGTFFSLIKRYKEKYVKMPKKRAYNESHLKRYRLVLMPFRYLFLLALLFSLPVIYLAFTPLTVYPAYFLIGLFQDVRVIGNVITLVGSNINLEIAPACVAGSAYLLLMILNLSVPMPLRKRMDSILFSVFLLLCLNIFRIFILSIFLVIDPVIFDMTHLLFWYILSIVFVVGIWFYSVYLFSIKEIPIMTDLKTLLKNIKRK